jgi:hypothetical protein
MWANIREMATRPIAKVEVEDSNPFARSSFPQNEWSVPHRFGASLVRCRLAA